jgi:hypothetical protein
VIPHEVCFSFVEGSLLCLDWWFESHRYYFAVSPFCVLKQPICGHHEPNIESLAWRKSV